VKSFVDLRHARGPLLSLAVLWVACSLGCPGGGGSGHVPPDRIESGKPTPIEVEYYVWGYGWGALDRRFTELECHYRTDGGEFRALTMEIIRVAEQKLVARCVLPPFSAAEESVEYWFSYHLDGHRNVRGSEFVPIIATP
jgi:hypothetical protein